MKTPTIPGTTHTQTITVDRTLIVPPRLGSLRRPPGHASHLRHGLHGRLHGVGLHQAMQLGLELGEHTVSAHTNIGHVAATPIGLKMTAAVELVAAEGRKLGFRASECEEVNLIGEAAHERAVIYPEKVMARLTAKGRVA